MRQHRQFLTLFFLAFGLLLTACLQPAAEQAAEPIEVTRLVQVTADGSEAGTATAAAIAATAARATATTPASTPETERPTATATLPASTVPAANVSPAAITHDATNVRLGPGLSYGVAQVLPAGATWPVVGKNLDSTWWAVLLNINGPGPYGWVSGTAVTLVGDLNSLPFISAPTLTPVANLPVVSNDGPPPGDRCLVSRRGQFPMPNVYQGAGRHFPIIAHLENWTEVRQSVGGWHLIAVAPGQDGWLAASDADLIGTCTPGEIEPQRIHFDPGAISTIVDGRLHPPARDSYLFRALAGQRAILEINSTYGRANFMLSGVTDGQPYKRLEDEQRLWSAVLSLTQDYLLTVAAPADAPITEYSLELTIEPLNTDPPASGLAIDSFTVAVDELPDNGRQMTFQWVTHGGTSARILSGSAERFQPVWEVPLSGELTVDLN